MLTFCEHFVEHITLTNTNVNIFLRRAQGIQPLPSAQVVRCCQRHPGGNQMKKEK